MPHYRQPVSGAQLAGAGFAVVAAIAAHVLVPAAGETAWVLALLLLVFAVQPLATLGHELGHALAVGLLGRRPCLVVVGRGPHLRIRAEPATVLFSVMPTRGVPFSGVCRHESRGLSSRTAMWIALAGPAATAVELIAAVAVAFGTWTHVGPTPRLLLLLTLSSLVATLILNLWPERAALGRPAGPAPAVRRDGSKALLSRRLHHAELRTP